MVEDSSVSDVRLFLLGSPRVEYGGAPVEVDTRKATALLAYLAVTQKRHGRDALAALLWPEYPQGRARAAQRRTLSALGPVRGEGRLEVDRAGVALAGGVWVDVQRFRELLDECGTHGHPPADVCQMCLPTLSEAAALYRGDFLAGFGIRDSFNFDDWQYLESESLRRELGEALDKLVRGHGARGEWEPAIAHARRRLALDPLSEPAHRALIQAYALSGERAGALRQYRECVRLLDKELGVAPLSETTELYRTVREGRDLPSPTFADTQRGASGSISSEAPDTRRSSSSPLVGRNREWEILQGAYDATSEGQFVILEGEAGIGKTRLAEEFLTFSRSRGATTLAARCYAGEANLTFGPFIQALEPATARPDLAGRLAEIPTPLLAEATRLLPNLGDTFPDLPLLPRLDGPGAQSRFFEGVCQALTTICGEPRGILFLDDLQWSDEASLDLLTYLVRRLSGKPLCIIAAWRAEEVPAGHRLRGLVREAQRAGVGTLLPLERLERSVVAEMVRSVTEGSDTLSERLYDETEGLPLFVTEYLAAIAKGELSAEGDWSLPGGVRDLLYGRLQTVGETAGQLLGAAAAVGRSFDFDTVREASGRGEEEAIAAIEELVSRRLIQELAEASGEGGPLYDFYHEKLRDLVYEETSLARRRLVHRRIAASLAARAHRRRVGALSGEISRHYHLAGQDARAAEYSKLAGEHARALYANADALSHFQTALALGHPHPSSLHEAIGDLHALMGEYSAALASYETAAALHDEKTLSTIERKLGSIHGLQGEWELADIHYSAALAALEGPGQEQAGERAGIFADRSRLAHQRGRTMEAAELARRALNLAESADDRQALAQAHNMLGILANNDADPATSYYHLERSLTLAEEMQDPYARVAALNNLALARGKSGETEEALALARSALALCATLGDRHREAALHNNLADLLHTSGRREESMQHLKQAVAIFTEIGESALQPEIWKLVEW